MIVLDFQTVVLSAGSGAAESVGLCGPRGLLPSWGTKGGLDLAHDTMGSKITIAASIFSGPNMKRVAPLLLEKAVLQASNSFQLFCPF